MPAATIASIDTLALRIPLDTWAPPPQFAGRPRTHVDMLAQIASPISISAGPFAGGSVVTSELEYEKISRGPLKRQIWGGP